MSASQRTRALLTTEAALLQSQKMEAMGQLTGGVAHDFNNLLTPIIGALDMLIRRGLGNDGERRLIDGALQSADRAKTLVQRLLAFARRQPLQPVAVDLAGLVNGMASLIESTVGPSIVVRVELEENLPPASADANQIEMAILNLGVNARDAMPGGGTLTITAARENVCGDHRSGLKQGDYVSLSVSDIHRYGQGEGQFVRGLEDRVLGASRANPLVRWCRQRGRTTRETSKVGRAIAAIRKNAANPSIRRLEGVERLSHGISRRSRSRESR